MKAQWITVNTRILCALFLRRLFFAGFVSGDDPASARNALVSTHGQYPPPGDVCVCAFRPLVLFPVALSHNCSGWSECAFVFPPLLASLISLYPVSPMPYTHVMTGDPWRKSNLIIYTIIGNEKERIRFTENREGIRK